MLVSLAWLVYIYTKKKLLIFSCHACLALVFSEQRTRYTAVSSQSRGVQRPRSFPVRCPPNFRWIFLRVQLTMLPTRTFTGVAHRAWSQSQVSAHLSVSLYLISYFLAGCSALCVSGTYCCICWTKRKQRTPYASAYPSTNTV